MLISNVRLRRCKSLIADIHSYAIWELFTLRKLAILILFTALLLAMIVRPVAAQDRISQIQTAITGAEASLNTFLWEFREYWFNVSDEVKFQSLNDAHESRLDLAFAKDRLNQKDYDKAMELAYRSWFRGTRATFRLYVFMTWAKIQDANETIMKIPSSIPKPSGALKILDQANKKYNDRSLQDVFEMDWPGPENLDLAQAYIRAMTDNKRELYSGEGSAARLADQAKDEAVRYLKQYEPVVKAEIEEKTSALKTRILLTVLLPIIVGGMLLAPSAGYLYRRLGRWLKNLKVTWDGNLFYRKIVGSTFIAGNALLAGTSGSLLAAIFEARSLSTSYYLQVAPYADILIQTTSLGLVAFIISLMLAIFGGAKLKWRRKSGIMSVTFTAIGFVLLASSLVVQIIYFPS